MSGGGRCAAGDLDGLWPVLLSMGPLLEMDSNMHHDDDYCQSDTETTRGGNQLIQAGTI